MVLYQAEPELRANTFMDQTLELVLSSSIIMDVIIRMLWNSWQHPIYQVFSGEKKQKLITLPLSQKPIIALPGALLPGKQ